MGDIYRGCRNIIDITKRTTFNAMIGSIMLFRTELRTINAANAKKQLLVTEMNYRGRAARTFRMGKKMKSKSAKNYENRQKQY